LPSTLLPRLGLPLELGRTDPDGVSGLDPRPTQCVIDPQTGEVALEPLGRLLDLEVRLGRDPLDPLAADAERSVLVVDDELVRNRLDPVDHDASRLRRRAQLVG